jgi:hypothetical protein
MANGELQILNEIQLFFDRKDMLCRCISLFRRVKLLSLLILLAGCSAKTNSHKILGTWESVLKKELVEKQLPALRELNRTVVFTFKRDSVMTAEMKRRNEVLDSYDALYSIDNSKKKLVFYANRDTSKKDVAEILKLTDSELVLFFRSGVWDTLMMKRR